MISIYWIFALKYWSVSLKFELVVQEKDINTWKWLVDGLLVGGIVLLTTAQAVETYYNVAAIKNPKSTQITDSTHARMFSFTEVVVMFLACVIMFDAMWRIRKTNIQNSTIKMKQALIVSVAYIAQLVFDIVLQFEEKGQVTLLIIQRISYTISVGILAFILFQIGVQAAES